MKGQQGLIGRVAALGLIYTFGVAMGGGQTQEIDQLRERPRQLQQFTQESLQELKAQIAALHEEAQKPPGDVPALPAPLPSASTSGGVPTAQFPVNIGEATRLRQAAENEDGAPSIDNESLGPSLRGILRLRARVLS